MNATTVAIDLAKDVFELAFADAKGRIVQRKRLRRARFLAEFQNRPQVTIIMEACGTAHYWARRLAALGHTPVLLPPRHCKPFVRGCH